MLPPVREVQIHARHLGAELMKRRPILLAAAVVASLLAIAFSGLRTRSQYGVDAATANSKIHQRFEIPASATDVDFATNVRSSHADFAISQDVFLDWVNRHEWRLRSVSAEEPCWFAPVDGAVEPYFFAEGFTFDGMDGNVGYTGGFDAEKQRAWIVFGTN